MDDLMALWEDAATTTTSSSESQTATKTTATTEHASSSSSSGPCSESNEAATDNNNTSSSWKDAGADLLYHDILMHVFTFLDAPDLTAFSETARRPNFECFYFLQLQLQRALLLGDSSAAKNLNTTATTAISIDKNDDTDLSSIAGVAAISRLATLDRPAAESVVQSFLDSNSTLRTMPLSHSLAYIRQVLRRSGYYETGADHVVPQQKALASAALFITVMGAASFMGASPESVVAEMASSFGTDNMLFKVGFVGSLMGAAHARTTMHPTAQDSSTTTTADTDAASSTNATDETKRASPTSMLSRAEQLARQHWSDLNKNNNNSESSSGFSLARLVQVAYNVTYGPNNNAAATTAANESSSTGANNLVVETLSTPDPYEHLPSATSTTTSASSDTEGTTTDSDDNATVGSSNSSNNNLVEKEPRKMPSGCVGAYSRAVSRANACIVDAVKARRKAALAALSETEQQQISSDLIDACCSDEAFTVVQDCMQRGAVNVEGFYMGSDGTETCALHAAAFHGSCQILELLCSGIDESDPSKDGGLCDINLIDSNGWTAMHFAAGANSPEAVRILAKHGAALSVEAANGYTPLQWAVRLQNTAVADELRLRMGTERHLGWISRQPLSAIASRFFALIPSH